MSLANARVSTRLIAGFSLILVLLIVILGVGVMRLSEFNDNVKVLTDDKVPKLIVADAWMVRVLESANHTRNMLILEDKAKIQAEVEAIQAGRKLRKEYLENLQQSITSVEGKTALQRVLDARAVYVPLEDEFIKLVLAGDTAGAKDVLLQKMEAAQDLNISALEKLVELEKNFINKASATTEQDYHDGRNLLIALGLVTIAMGVIAATHITRSLLKQLGGEPVYAASVANQIAAGDLTAHIDTSHGDQSSLLFAIKSMRNNLAGLVAQVRTGTDIIQSSSAQIASGNQDLSSRTEEQASSLEETASSMEELTSTVRQNADNALHASELAMSASSVAVKGGEVVSQVVETMESINASSKKIVDIISVIDGIAFQTNILALNAAVEAARAGEQGRGFAVVATEVRNLAQRSAAAAKEIKMLIGDSVDKIENGTKLVGQAGETIKEVVDSVKRVTSIVNDITTASREQTVGIEQINQAVVQMDEATQQNAALVEEAAASSEAMREEAEKLSQVVGVFKLSNEQMSARSVIKAIAAKPVLSRVAPQLQAKAVALVKPMRKLPALAVAGGDWEQF